MTNGEYWIACKDPGGREATVPVASRLARYGKNVRLIASGKAAELLTAERTPFTTAGSATDLVAAHGWPEALVTSICSGGGLGRDLVPLLRSTSYPIVAVHDQYGMRLTTDWAPPEFRPDSICENDEVGKRITAKAWPDFDPRRIVVAGYAALDKYAAFYAGLAATEARKRMRLDAPWPVIFYAGQTKHSGHALRELVEALNEHGSSAYLIVRGHPRMQTDAPEELPKWQEALSRLKRGRLIEDCWPPSTLPGTIAASNVVISMYSLVFNDACALRRPCIAMLYPDTGMAWFLKDSGGIMNEFPLVELGCVRKVTNRKELDQALMAALKGNLGLETAQASHFRIDGKNADRIARHVLGLPLEA